MTVQPAVRRRLLFMADAFDMRGGGEIVVHHLSGALRERSDVTVLTTTRGPDTVQQSDGLTVHQLHSTYHPRLRPIASFCNPRLTGKIARLLRQLRPDVVHAWNVHGHLSYDALRLAHGSGARVVHTFQDAGPFCYSKYKCWLDPNAPLPERPDYRARPRDCRSCRFHYWTFPPRAALIRRWLSRYVHRGVSVSAELQEALRQNGVTAHDVVPNGLPLDDPAFVGASAERARARHGWGDDPVLITGGRLHFFKGQNQAVDAFAKVAKQHPTARLAILGDKGWFRDTLEQRVAGFGLADRVSFPGFLDRVAYHDCLAASTAFLNLSTYLDPFPTVNLESMALGVPVIGTRLGGTPEAIVDQETGFLVNPFDVDDVAAKALRLIEEPALKHRFGEAGKRRVEQLYTVQHMAAAYEAIYQCR
ncbi:MAG: glycosyltransferase family 4 protein [Chloroflexota bacterium]